MFVDSYILNSKLFFLIRLFMHFIMWLYIFPFIWKFYLELFMFI